MDQSTKRLAVKLNQLLNEADGEDKVQLEPVPKRRTAPKPLKAALVTSQPEKVEQEHCKCPNCGIEENDFLRLKVGQSHNFRCDHCGLEYKARREY